ncbi:MAG TPA: hypothetical protein VJ464_18105 [Blastocatellia bacterium]|nr:hypothetical protein [Blastocatellia bacterium]
MLFVLLIWLQAAPLSKKVIVIASLLFVLAIVLLVYFVRKLRSSSKTEDDWSMTRSSLFVEPPPVSDTSQAAIETTPVPGAPAGETRLLTSEPLDVTPQALDVAPQAEEVAPPAPAKAPPATELLGGSPSAPVTDDERHTRLISSPSLPAREGRATEVLSSYSPVPPAPPAPPEPPAPEAEVAETPATDEAVPFDEEVWSGLGEIESPQPTEATAELRPPAAPPIEPPPAVVEPPPAVVEPLHEARVEQRPPRAAFEPPTVEPLHKSREPFEPPVISPITPREQTALLGARPQAAADELPRPPADRPAAKSDLPHEPPRPEPTAPLYSDRAARLDRDSETAAPDSSAAGTPTGGQVWDTVTAATANRSRPAGAVLGLPTERGQGPLVLGTPARSREEIGIGALTDYGKVDKEGGRGGLILLAIALLVFGGAALAYFLVPSVHERVNSWVARSRGIDPNEATSSQPKAMIFPSRVPETDKNLVHAKGAVQNISNDALENLALDVQLNKSGGDTEMINVPVTPAQLAPNDQGNYAFDYDGKGVLSYTIKRLSSNGKEVRFTAPGQK